MLYDNTNNLLPVLPSQGRHDFIVEHDLKEIGAHTCVSHQGLKHPSKNPSDVLANPVDKKRPAAGADVFRALTWHRQLQFCVYFGVAT